MQVAASLARQLRTLNGEVDIGNGLTAQLSQLATDLTHAIPSCIALSIVFVRLDHEVTLSVADRDVGCGVVLASLAVPLTAVAPNDVLVLRAGEAGAFLLLAIDLAGLLGPGFPPMEVDRHLNLPRPIGDTSADSFANSGAINQAVGVLIDRGWTREAARGELQRRAGAADLSLGVASRLLLKSVSHRAV